MNKIYLIFFILSINFNYSQKIENSDTNFLNISLESKTVFKIDQDLTLKNNYFDHFLLTSNPLSDYNFNTKKLNKQLFSNYRFIEHNYTSYESYLRGCGPLLNGITVPVDSDDLMLSMTIDNFINNILFDGRGPLVRLFSSKD
ncbi:hypothetical protein [uncultured Winogradskyella sp.]|uniref:hypothetical protein n=1 Tax=uncultured Winogradskyella sp. TaxID=395353 RepID=UPI002637EA52|nr:hypothetical protein [uncultured Winogradskyella sp.]